MLASGFSFVAVNGVVRALGTEIPAAQGAFLRFAFGVLFLLPVMPQLLRARLPASAWRLFSLRGLFHTAAVVCWFFAMARIPVAEVTAINYLNPVLVTVGGALLFREGMSWPRVFAIAAALVGTLIVLRPGVRVIEPGHVSQLCAAFFFAGSYLTAKRLSQIAPAGVVVAMMSVMVTIFLLPLALWVWVPVTVPQLVLLALAAIFATMAHYFMTRAFDCAPVTVTQPVVFLQLIWATLLGWLAFGEAVDPFVLLGGAIIIGAIAYLTWRDALRRRRATPAAAV
ncbi:DMT family transporter [Falsirhodobacter deserti]|uniref:DMT family transporter n=1 Tax=Falsirhodobacter deserti TaxID=1365611 RepID=UPI000FE3AFB6